MNLVLIGMMGSGKTAVGRILARKLGWKLYDSDALIEREERATIARLFETLGEAGFRELERKMIARLATEDDCVIATGGGAPCFKDNWAILSRHGTLVWLKVSPSILAERLRRDGGRRPLLKDSPTQGRIEKILKAREPVYGKAALTVETDGLSPEEVAEQILARIPLERTPAR